MAGVIFKELLDQTERTTADSGTSAPTARIRIWRCLTPSADAVRGDPQCPIAFQSTHPSDRTLFCDKVDTSPDGNGNTLLTAYFSRDRRYRTAVLRRVPVERESWGWGARDVVVEIPSNIRRLVRWPVGPSDPPGAPTTKLMWALTKIKLSETRMQRTIRVTFPLALFDQLDYIAGQNRVIHTIRGNRYQFLPDLNAVKRIDAVTYEARYMWELDQGTFATAQMVDPSPTGMSSAIALEPGLAQPPSPPYILRLPYATLTELPFPVDTFNPEFNRFCAKNIISVREDPAGWRSLPGCPNLD